MTHYIPPSSARPIGRDEFQALCGAWILDALHANDPSCPQCRAALLEDEVAIEDLRQEARRAYCADCGRDEDQFRMWWVPFGTHAICAGCRQQRIGRRSTSANSLDILLDERVGDGQI